MRGPFTFGPAEVWIESSWHDAEGAMLDTNNEVIPLCKIDTGHVNCRCIAEPDTCERPGEQ